MKKIAIIISIIYLFSAPLIFAAVAFESETDAKDSSVTKITQTHTSTGSNRYVVVGLSIRATGAAPTGVSASYDGVAMTSLGEATGGGLQSYVFMFGLVNPNTTVNATVSSTWTNTANKVKIGIVSFTGASGSGASSTFSSGSTSNPSLTVASAVGDMVIDTLAMSFGGTATSTQTQRWSADPDTLLTGGGATAAGAANVTMAWNSSSADQANYMGVNITASVAASASTPTHIIRSGRIRNNAGR